MSKTKSLRPNYWYAILSIALVLVLLGFFSMLLLQSQYLVANLKEKINIILEIKDDTSREDIARIEQKLQERAFVKEHSIQFVSKEQALEQLRADFGEDFMQLDMVNPLYNSLIFNVKAAYLEADFLANLRRSLLENENIRDVYYQKTMIDTIAQNLSKIAWVGLLIGGFFLLVAMFLIHNTTRLALYSKRLLIKNMELVGASWGFVSRPFIVRGLVNGFLGACIAILILGAIFYWLDHQINGLQLLQDRQSLLGVGALLLVLGVAISGWSTYAVVRKYLSMRLDDLY